MNNDTGNSRRIVVDTASLPFLRTSHAQGGKKLISAGFDKRFIIKQIAIGRLLPGEHIEEHIHPDMDEAYFFTEGSGEMTLDDQGHLLKPDLYIYVEAGTRHSLSNDTDSTLCFIYYSLALADQ